MAGNYFSRSQPSQRLCSHMSPYHSRQGLRGLLNIGLSCCVNATLQCFSATPELVALLDKWTPADSEGIEGDCNVALHLQRALRAMQSDRTQPAPHRDFLQCLDRNHIRLYVQQDADEVFLAILNFINNQITNNELARQIRCLYMVRVETYLQCLECTFEECGESYLLSLPLPLHDRRNCLEDCIRSFFMLQELNYSEKCLCAHCDEKKPSKQGFRLISLPPVLRIHLKRFHSNHGYTKKMHCRVSFPQTLDFKKILSPENLSPQSKEFEGESQYNLYAVIVHCGEARFGHYTAYIQHKEDQSWYYANDSNVCKVSWDAVTSTYGSYRHDKTAYMLLYRRVEVDPQGGHLGCSG